MTKLIDWSKAPEGTTHAYLAEPGFSTPTWYKLDVIPDGPTRLYYHDLRQWVPSTNTLAWFNLKHRIYTRQVDPTPTSDREVLAEALNALQGFVDLADLRLERGPISTVEELLVAQARVLIAKHNGGAA